MGVLRGAGLWDSGCGCPMGEQLLGSLSWHSPTPSLKNRASAWGKESSGQEADSAGEARSPAGGREQHSEGTCLDLCRQWGES